MDPHTPWPLVWGSLFALPAAVLARYCLPAAAALAAFGILVALGSTHRYRWAGLCALPAMLAAIELPEPARVWPRPGPVHVAGRVTDVQRAPQTGETTVRLGSGRRAVRLHLAGPVRVLPGDRLAATACLSPTIAPGQVPTLHAASGAVRIQTGPPSVPRAAAAARRALEQELLRLVPGESGALLATLALGRGTAPAADLTEAHQATGLSHLLAVSGAHAAMLAWLLGLGGSQRGHRLGASRLRTILALLVLFAYAAITGGEPPVLRTVVAFTLGAIATATGRPLTLVAGLLTPALLTALVQPDALLGPSFLLSYAAVIGLAVAGHAAEGFWQRWLWAPLRASFWATLLTAPLTLFWFGQLAPWTVLLTPLLAPLVGVLLLGSLVAATAGCLVPGAGTPFGWLLSLLAELYAAAVRAADHLPLTPLHAPHVPPPWALLLAALFGAGALLRHRNRFGIGLGAALLAAPHFVPLQPPSPARVCLFAIGHGQAALVQTANGLQGAIDCGSLQQPLRTARRFVQTLTHRRLDLLVVTHADQDHHNGVPALVRQLPIARAVLPTALRGAPVACALQEAGTEVQFLAPGERCAPAAGFRVAAPWLPPGASDNDQSLWVHVDLGTTTALLTGDAEVLGVAAALAQDLAPPSDLLVLPHHGRPNPLAHLLLQRVRPQVCFASAATGDGDTAQGAVVRGSGSDLWVTGRHGDLELLAGPPPCVRSSVPSRPLRRAVTDPLPDPPAPPSRAW